MIVRIGDSSQVSNFNQPEMCFMGNGYTFRPGTSKEYPKRSVSATIINETDSGGEGVCNLAN